jgi:hypothetical protein
MLHLEIHHEVQYHQIEMLKSDFLIKLRIGFEINGQISGMKKNGKKNDEKMLYVLHDL